MEYERQAIERFTKQMNVGKQRDARAEINAHVQVKQINTNYCDAIISNLSTTGFMLNCHARFNQQQTIFLHVKGLQALGAKIQWTNDGSYGCQFTNPLYPAVFDHMVSRLS